MAEAIGVLSGGLTLVEVAAKSGLTVVKLMSSFQNHNKCISDLQQEFGSLNGLLCQLGEAVKENPTEFAALDALQRQCTQICKDFEALITKCSAHFDENKTSVRDWIKLQMKEDEINSLKSLIASYKSSITVALGCITLHTVKMTAEDLHKWQRMIADTTFGLEEQLGRTDHRLETLAQHGAFISHADVVEQDRLQIEKRVIENCLTICAQGASETKQLLDSVLNAEKEANNKVTEENLPELRTLLDMIRGNKGRYYEILPAFQIRLRDIDDKLDAVHASVQSRLSQTTQDQKSLLKLGMKICEEASAQASKMQRNLFEDVTTSDEAYQMIVATPNELVSAKRVHAGPRSVQYLGTFSEAAQLQMSKDRVAVSQISAGRPQTTDRPACQTAENISAPKQPKKKGPSKRRQTSPWTRALRTLAAAVQK